MFGKLSELRAAAPNPLQSLRGALQGLEQEMDSSMEQPAERSRGERTEPRTVVSSERIETPQKVRTTLANASREELVAFVKKQAGQIKDLQKQNEDLQATGGGAGSDVLRRQLAVLEKQLAEMHEMYDSEVNVRQSLENNHDGQLRQLTERAMLAERNIMTLRAENSNLTSKGARYEGELEAAHKSAERLKAELAAAQGRASEAETEARKLLQELETVHAQRAAAPPIESEAPADSEASRLAEMMESHRTEMASLQTTNISLNDRIAALQSELEEARTERDAAALTREKMSEALGQMSGQLEKLHLRAGERDEEITRLNAEVEAARQKQTAEKEGNAKQAKKDARVKELEAQLKESDKTLMTVREELNKVREELARAREEVKQHAAELAGEKESGVTRSNSHAEELRAVQAALAAAQGEAREAARELAEVREDLERARAAEGDTVAIESRAVTAEARLTQMEKEFEDYKKRANAALKSRAAEQAEAKESELLRKQISETHALLEEANETIQSLRDDIERAQKDTGKALRDLENAEDEKTSLQRLMETKQAQYIREKDMAQTVHRNEMKQLEDAWKERVAAGQREVQDSQETLSRWLEERDIRESGLKKNIQALESRVEALEAEKEEAAHARRIAKHTAQPEQTAKAAPPTISTTTAAAPAPHSGLNPANSMLINGVPPAKPTPSAAASAGVVAPVPQRARDLPPLLSGPITTADQGAARLAALLAAHDDTPKQSSVRAGAADDLSDTSVPPSPIPRQTSLREVSRSSSFSTAAVPRGLAGLGGTDSDAETRMLHFAHVQAQRDEEVTRSRAQVKKLTEANRELETQCAMHAAQEKLLKEEVRRLERNQSREGTNLEYVKNVVLGYMSTGNETLIPVIGTLMQFSPTELKAVKDYRKSQGSILGAWSPWAKQ